MTCENISPGDAPGLKDVADTAVAIVAAWAEDKPDTCKALWDGLTPHQQELVVRCQAKLGHRLAAGREPHIETDGLTITLRDLQAYGEAARLMLGNGRGPAPADLTTACMLLCRLLETMVTADPVIHRAPAQFWRGFAHTVLAS